MHVGVCTCLAQNTNKLINLTSGCQPENRYLPGAATYARPGLKLKFAGTSLAAQFPDQFAPFAAWTGNDMTTSFKGTLFRFPLRSATTALSSDLKNTPYVHLGMRASVKFHLWKSDTSYCVLY